MPRYLQVLAVAAAAAGTAVGMLAPAEHQALLDLYNATAGPSWVQNSGWGSGVGDPCADAWQGVQCDESGTHVTFL
jgi:hypothetical protein